MTRMVQLLLYWVVSVIALLVSAWVAKSLGFDIMADTDRPTMLFLGVALLGIINATVGVVLKALTAPLACATFGIAWLFVNAALFYWVGQWRIGFTVGDFWSAFAGSMLMSLALGLFRRFVEGDGKA
jgi:putative membrane protein